MRFTVLLLAAAQTVTSAVVQRALPVEFGCTPCSPNDGPHYDAAAKATAEIDPALLAEGKASFDQTFDAGYHPALCDAHPVNCITGAAGVTWTGTPGLTAPLGRWRRKDGTDTIAWGYWQQTLQWTGAGGSGTTYNAHCTILTCVKGRMQATIGTESIKGDGKTDDSAENICGCFPKDLDADITFSLF
ncbi:hypothetical protein CB0940_10918 [Cercospora beticola]|uniref:Secreted protein n=1 Tax=Cercospora beticola TaxID=122368 RepID=A0A2G5HD27_CERBT|nr:hypothetical protein CB0940_10918 [Cercospora beticola]PIA90441.1 hypothetical protein CB0940_10918 [Cercospora beticola]WPB07741.1 hypothetical protein RHO25_012404 [Cercospora beticola]